jgi:hypothetical protein
MATSQFFENHGGLSYQDMEPGAKISRQKNTRQETISNRQLLKSLEKKQSQTAEQQFLS